MILNFLLFALLAVIDQLTKYLISNSLTLYEKIKVIDNFFYLTHTHNTGAAWSILSGGRFFFIVTASAVVIAIFVYLYKQKKLNLLLKIALILIAAGAFGNLLDRILYGYVIDFLDFYIFGYDFPVFNFADCCLTIGVGLMIIDTLFTKEEKNGTA